MLKATHLVPVIAVLRKARQITAEREVPREGVDGMKV
jgi:hypothetical protein